MSRSEAAVTLLEWMEDLAQRVERSCRRVQVSILIG